MLIANGNRWHKTTTVGVNVKPRDCSRSFWGGKRQTANGVDVNRIPPEDGKAVRQCTVGRKTAHLRHTRAMTDSIGVRKPTSEVLTLTENSGGD